MNASPTRATNDDEVVGLRAKIRDLELALGQNNQDLAVAFRLTEKLNNLFGLLLSVPNVTPEMIRQRLELASDPKVAIHRLRRHLKPYGIKIQSRRNLGYWLDNADKEKIRAMITAQVSPIAPPTGTAEDATPKENVAA